MGSSVIYTLTDGAVQVVGEKVGSYRFTDTVANAKPN